MFTNGYRFALALRRLLCALATVALASVGVFVSAPPASADTSQFRGMNWARKGDNFTTGTLVLDGLSGSDSYATLRAKADAVFAGMANLLGVNTVRLRSTPTPPTSAPARSRCTWRRQMNGSGALSVVVLPEEDAVAQEFDTSGEECARGDRSTSRAAAVHSAKTIMTPTAPPKVRQSRSFTVPHVCG
ncbi:MAG: hypothetical protein WBA97_38545 [Actinophytocola sp.]|uniref:hypothetical protein n=1 Tax=Actinophytocola sp. TaxID=1872138 RepID=UPI003C7708AF